MSSARGRALYILCRGGDQDTFSIAFRAGGHLDHGAKECLPDSLNFPSATACGTCFRGSARLSSGFPLQRLHTSSRVIFNFFIHPENCLFKCQSQIIGKIRSSARGIARYAGGLMFQNQKILRIGRRNQMWRNRAFHPYHSARHVHNDHRQPVFPGLKGRHRLRLFL